LTIVREELGVSVFRFLACGWEAAGSHEMPVPTYQTTCFRNQKDTIKIFISMKTLKSHSLTHFLLGLNQQPLQFTHENLTHSITHAFTHHFLLCESQQPCILCIKTSNFTQSLTHSLTHSLTNSRSLSLSLTHSPLPPLREPATVHFIHKNLKLHSLTDSLTNSLSLSLTTSSSA
jgi:hypothetical protein